MAGVDRRSPRAGETVQPGDRWAGLELLLVARALQIRFHSRFVDHWNRAESSTTIGEHTLWHCVGPTCRTAFFASCRGGW